MTVTPALLYNDMRPGPIKSRYHAFDVVLIAAMVPEKNDIHEAVNFETVSGGL
jgi:hypothetical protein